MNFIQRDPAKIYLTNYSEEEYSLLFEKLTYSDKTIDHQIRQLKNNPYYYRSMGEQAFSRRLEELKAEQKKQVLFQDKGGIYTMSGLRSYLKQVMPTASWDSQILYPDLHTLPFVKAPKFKLRDYQEKSLSRLLEFKHANIELATGAGKTAVLLYLAREVGLKTVVAAPSTDIATTIYKLFCEHLGKNKVGLFAGSKKETGKLITVATAQSLTRIEEGSDAWIALSNADCFMFDECFPHRTQVITEDGVMRISKIHRLYSQGKRVPKVLSYNEDLKLFEYKKVLRTWEREFKNEMVKVSFGDRYNIKCTRDHKVLTTLGWRSAGSLSPGDAVISYDSENKKNSFGKMMNDDQFQIFLGSYLGDGNVDVRKNGKVRLRWTHSIDQSDYLSWKAFMFGCGTKIVPHNGYSGKPAVRACTPTLWSPIVFRKTKKRSCPKEVLDLLDRRGLAIWYMDDGSLNKTNAIFHTECFDYETVTNLLLKLHSMGYEGKIYKYLKKGKSYSIIGLTKSSTEKLHMDIAPYCHKNLQYKLPLLVGGYEWSCFYEQASISVVKDVVDLDLKDLCEGNPERNKHLSNLYDIEVEDNHNFIVGSSVNHGIVAHNCHLVAAATFFKIATGICAKASYRFFCSATPERNDGKGLLMQSIIGDTVVRKSIRNLIEEGYLAKIATTIFDVQSDDTFSSQNAVKMNQHHLYSNMKIVSFICDVADSAFRQGIQVLILIDEHDQEALLKSYMRTPYEYASGASDNHKIIDDFNAGKVMCVVGTSAVSVGSDFRSNKITVAWQGGKAGTKVKQGPIGRSTRKDERTNKDECSILAFRITNVPMMKKHANVCISHYEDVGPVAYRKL